MAIGQMSCKTEWRFWNQTERGLGASEASPWGIEQKEHLAAVNEAGAAAEVASLLDLGDHYVFEPTAVDTLGVFNASTRHLLNDPGRRTSLNSGEATETSYLYQTISVLMQRFNALLLHHSLPAADSCLLVNEQNSNITAGQQGTSMALTVAQHKEHGLMIVSAFSFSVQFLHAWRYASAVFATATCPDVRPSVTRRYCA